GFEVKADLKTQIEEYRRLREQLETTEAALKKAEKEHKRYNQSMSWKVTSPLRSVSQLFKKGKSKEMQEVRLMKETAPILLPQLPNEIVTDARKTRLCAYAVALEGWRRGLKLKWYTKDSEHFQDMVVFGVNPPGRLFSLSSDTATHYFFRTRGDLVPNEAVEIGSEKDDTKIHLD